MSKDPYANYVIKIALKVLEEGEQRDRLFSILLSHQAELVSRRSYHNQLSRM